MHSLGRRLQHSQGRILAASAVAAVLAASAHADLLHKYTFNANNAVDSVGGVNGTVIDPAGIVTYTGGAINLTANEGAVSGQDFSLPTTVGAYVDLENDILTNAVLTDVAGQATLEMWLTPQQNRTWAEGFVFGTGPGDENAAEVGSTYVAYIPLSGPGDNRGTTRDAGPPDVETPIIGGPPLPVNQKHHVVLVLDQTDSMGGVNLRGTATLYLNNGAPVTAPIQPFIDSMINNKNWLGRSLFGGDPLYDGLIDEFRIYNHALSAAEVAASNTTGPDPSSTPVLVVDRDSGDVSLKNESAAGIQIKGYSIASPGGALNVAGWASIDGDNGFDPDGAWTPQSSASTLIAESVTSGATDGGTLAAGASRGIGAPWFVSPIEDLAFSFTLGDGSTGTGQIVYAGTAPPRADLDGDGIVDEADWALFLPHSFTAFPGDAAVAAYLKGDFDGDNDNDYADFKIFKAEFVAAQGEAAFAALGVDVPEPAGGVLLVAYVLALAVNHRRARQA